jgi:hypothetical protein
MPKHTENIGEEMPWAGSGRRSGAIPDIGASSEKLMVLPFFCKFGTTIIPH